MENSGLGPRVENPEGVLLKEGWFSTNRFLLEMIFDNRMKRYECLTNDSSLASANYVPFYAGLDLGRYLWDYNTSIRDSCAFDIASGLSKNLNGNECLVGITSLLEAGLVGILEDKQTSILIGVTSSCLCLNL
ncbi:hypothetical protein LWI29_009805 [Acer saccharum]|uniref:Exostosin GT47 domain-containing protein n=1 Tax=Acer saccharum TaxID=4024 RepID=A0AA39TPP7_ACESA|nr:hypothetical protein LWI29_009805 [Acer saccharum]KAK1591137.1 hypothetical protein Q3G72_002816 [Acer saccharum]